MRGLVVLLQRILILGTGGMGGWGNKDKFGMYNVCEGERGRGRI